MVDLQSGQPGPLEGVGTRHAAGHNAAPQPGRPALLIEPLEILPEEQNRSAQSVQLKGSLDLPATFLLRKSTEPRALDPGSNRQPKSRICFQVRLFANRCRRFGDQTPVGGKTRN